MPRGVDRYDEARLQGRLWVPGGLTNLVKDSAALTTANWVTFANGTGSITRTANAAQAPDTTITATKIAINRSATTDYAQFNQTVTMSAVAYVGQIWVKAFAAGDIGLKVEMFLYTGTAHDLRGFTSVTLTDGWQRITSTATMLASAGAQMVIGYSPLADGGMNQTGAVTFLAWGANLSTGSTAVPYLRTGSSAISTATAGLIDDTTKADAYDYWRYGIGTAQLAASHRYKNRPPMIGP